MHPAKKWAGILLLVCCALLTYGATSSARLRAQAIELAAGEPFCVQVPDRLGIVRPYGMEYLPAWKFSDTWGLGMIGRGGFHHAVLIVGDPTAPRSFHWSYFKHKFVEGTYGPFPIVCQSALRYFERQDNTADDKKMRFTLAGRTMAIPKQYYPEPQWPGSMVGYSFCASWPLFQPPAESCIGTQRPTVWVAFETDDKPYGLAQVLPPQGLRREKKFDGLIRIATPDQSDEYVEIGPDNKVVTSISCMVDCSHHFSANGLTFSFHHSPAALPQWREMQKRLMDLHTQFEPALAAGYRK
jgi:hypothetical protein